MGKQLDFSGIQQIAYKGFEDQEERDTLLQAGYTVVDTPTPFTAPAVKHEPLTTPPTGRDYKRLYRIAFDFHQRYNPPIVDLEYWKGKTPGLDDTPDEELRYWEEVARDAGKTSAANDNDPFLMDLLLAIVEELDREYKRLQKTA